MFIGVAALWMTFASLFSSAYFPTSFFQMNIAQAKSSQDQELVFTTKEEALDVILTHFTITELFHIYRAIQNGLTEEEQEALLTLLHERFTDEEISALKAIGMKELKSLFPDEAN